MIKGGEKLLYINKRSFTMYFVSLITVAMSIFVFYMIFSDLDKFFLEYSSRASGIAWMIFMICCGNIMLAIMLWLSFRYVLQIKQIDKETIAITTWSIIGYKKVYKENLSILQDQKFHLGQSSFANAPSVNAPYYTIKTSKGKTLILDLKAEFYF